MKNFEHAYTLLASDAGTSGVGLLRGGGGPARGENLSTADGDRASGGLAVQGKSRKRVDGEGMPSKQHENGLSVVVGAGDGGGGGSGGDWCDLEGLETLAELSIIGSGISSAERWADGPKDPRGTLIDLSDRPNICMSVLGNEAVIGSSDHALYGIDIRKGVKSRTLYTKQCGHTEWVTCVTHLKDGRVLSGGMDSKLCLWNKAGNRCVDLKAHSGSVSAVKADEGGVHAISAGYDGLVCVWDTVGHPSRALKSTLKVASPLPSLGLLCKSFQRVSLPFPAAVSRLFLLHSSCLDSCKTRRMRLNSGLIHVARPHSLSLPLGRDIRHQSRA